MLLFLDGLKVASRSVKSKEKDSWDELEALRSGGGEGSADCANSSSLGKK